jgi:hypothetical protein
MAKSRKYFRKHYKKHNRKHNKTHKKYNKTYKNLHKRKNKKNKSKKYNLRGGGDFFQGLVNSWRGTEHNINHLMNNWAGRPTPPGPLPTDQPELIRTTPRYFNMPNLSRFNEGADLRVSNMLQQ